MYFAMKCDANAFNCKAFKEFEISFNQIMHSNGKMEIYQGIFEEMRCKCITTLIMSCQELIGVLEVFIYVFTFNVLNLDLICVYVFLS